MSNIEELKRIIKLSNNIVFFGGAGVSTESNIPDFRSDKGLYNKNKYQYNAETMLSHDFFMNHNQQFYDFYLQEMIYPYAVPNNCHKALAKLEKMGKLKAVITQNIDGLHQMAGSKCVYELHGSVKRNHCMKCNNFMNELDMIEYHGRCSKCGGIVKPDVVLYQESLNQDILEKSIEKIANASVLIVGGTSLSVYPAAGLIRYFRGQYLILINRDKTPYDHYANIVIHEPIGEVLSYIIEEE